MKKIKILLMLGCVLILSACSQKANYDIAKTETEASETKKTTAAKTQSQEVEPDDQPEGNDAGSGIGGAGSAATTESDPFADVPEILTPVTNHGVTHTPYRVVNCNESITLRTSPNTAAQEICQISLGESVSMIEPAANGFYRIIYQEQEGFSLQQYLAADNQ